MDTNLKSKITDKKFSGTDLAGGFYLRKNQPRTQGLSLGKTLASAGHVTLKFAPVGG